MASKLLGYGRFGATYMTRRTKIATLFVATLAGVFIVLASIAACRKLVRSAATIPEHRLVDHVAPVQTLAFSPDSKFLVTGGDDKRALIWKVATGHLVRSIIGHESRISSLAFSRTGEILATASFDSTARLWLAADGTPRGTIQHPSNVSAIAFSPDDERIATGDFLGRVRIWDWKTDLRNETANIKVDNSWVFSLSFSPDGKSLAVGIGSHRVGVLKLRNHSQHQNFILPSGSDVIRCVAYAPDGRRIAAASGDDVRSGQVTVWEVSRSNVVRVSIHKPFSIAGLSFSPDGQQLAIGGQDGDVYLLMTSDLSEAARFKAHTAPITCISFSNDGNWLATASMDRTAALWSLRAVAQSGNRTRIKKSRL